MAAARQLVKEGVTTQEEYAADREQMLEDVARGFYQFWGPKCLKVMASPDGIVKLLDILLKEADPTLSDDDVKAVWAEEPEQVRDVLDLIRTEVEARAVQKKLLPAGTPAPAAGDSTSPASTLASSSPPTPAAPASPGPRPPG